MSTSNRLRLPSGNSIATAWKRVTTALKSSSILTDPGCLERDDEHSSTCHHRHATILPGYGKKEYPLPSSDQIVTNSIEFINEMKPVFARLQAATVGADKESETLLHFLARLNRHSRQSRKVRRIANQILERQARRTTRDFDEAGSPPRIITSASIGNWKLPKVDRMVPDLQGKMEPTSALVLRIGAGTLADTLHESRFKAVIAKQFDPHKGPCNWALTHMPAKYPAASLLEHVSKLEDIYGEALPRVMAFLGAQYDKASEEELLEAAVSVLNEQVAEILYVLSIWTDSFAQKQDGMYPELDYVVFAIEQGFHLFRTGDISGTCDADCQQRIKTQKYHVGDVIMARYGDQGPATIPGGRGPVGAHAIEVQHAERTNQIFWLPIYMHEFRHDFDDDVEGLADNIVSVAVAAIEKAHAAGKFKFSSETISLGKQQVKTIDMVKQIYAQTMSECNADIAGGVLLTGPAYGYSMLTTFSAFNMRGLSPFSVNAMLRHKSYYAVGEQGELAFEPHMPDFMRALVVADSVDILGFPVEAKELRDLSENAAGMPLPEEIIWHNIDPKSKFKFSIKLKVSDLRQVSPVVAEALMNEKLEALGGVATSQLVNWTKERQTIVETLARTLMQGKWDLPTNFGEISSNFVAAATVTAAWGLWKSGVQPKIALLRVEENARKMMDQVMHNWAEKEKAAAQTQSSAQSATSAVTPVQPTTSAPPSVPPVTTVTDSGDADDDFEDVDEDDLDEVTGEGAATTDEEGDQGGK